MHASWCPAADAAEIEIARKVHVFHRNPDATPRNLKHCFSATRKH